MQNFQDGFEIRKRSFISAFSICMTVPLNMLFIKCPNGIFYKHIVQNV